MGGSYRFHTSIFFKLKRVAVWNLRFAEKESLPQTVTQWMSPLGVAQWKIEIPSFRVPLPPTVTQRMSPLGVAQWKIEIPYFRGAVPPTVTQRVSPLGVAHWKSKQVPKIKCPPPRPETKKIHLLRKWLFLASGRGGGQIIQTDYRNSWERWLTTDVPFFKSIDIPPITVLGWL